MTALPACGSAATLGAVDRLLGREKGGSRKILAYRVDMLDLMALISPEGDEWSIGRVPGRGMMLAYFSSLGGGVALAL